MKTVVEMAEDVGAYVADLPLEDAVLFEVDILSGRSAKLEAFAALVRADERESCAAQLDFNARAASNGGDEYIAALLWQEAEEIRARGNT